MTEQFLLIESQGNWAGPNASRFLRDAVALAESGRPTTVFLVADGVFAAVDGAVPAVEQLTKVGARVWVDDFSLAQRALTAAPLAEGTVTVGMDAVAANVLSEDNRVVWH